MPLKNGSIFILVGFAVLVSACGSAQSALPTATNTRAVTITSRYTITASPTPEATGFIEPAFTEVPLFTETPLAQCPPTPVRPTLTATPLFYPTLLPEGPYLLCDTKSVIVMNVGTDSRRVTDLPEEVNGTISPDGKWIAYYSGSTESPYDLALHVFSMEDGSIHQVAKIFSPDYPGNLAVVADWHTRHAYSEGETPFTGEYIESTLGYKIQEFEWSPDGHYLAFAGQMDGPSSDLYIYDVQSGETRRMTADLRILDKISWSPDGKWLVIENVLPSLHYYGATLHCIRADSETQTDLSELDLNYWWWRGVGWATSTFYLIVGTSDGGGPYGLRYLNVETGRITELWPDEYFAYAVDPENQRFIVSGVYEYLTTNSREIEYGTYFVSASGQWEKITDDEFYTFAYRGGEDTQFIGLNGEEVVAISRDGKTTKINDNPMPIYYAHILVSPDRQWFVTFNESGDTPMILYSASDQPVRTFSEIEVTGALWFPDSSRLFVSSNGELYVVEVPDGTLTRFDMCSVSTNNLMWIP